MTWGLALAVIVGGLAWRAPEDAVAGTNVYRINAGGPQLENGRWSADQPPEPSEYANTSDTKIGSTNAPIDVSSPTLPSGTPSALFSTERWDPVERPRMRWKFPVPPGDYEVRLYFAETAPDAQGPGLRVFDVAMEGSVVLDDYDIFVAAGGGHRGVMASAVVTSDRRLRVAFRQVRNTPTVRGIEVLPADGEPDGGASPSEPAPTVAPTPPPLPSGGGSGAQCQGVSVASGANLQAAVDANPVGATFCLTGTYRLSDPVKPKSGQSFIGPAAIVGTGAETSFEAKYREGARNVSFVDLDVSGFTGSGLGCYVGTRVIGGRYHHNERNGIGCGLEGAGGVLIDGVELDHNGSLEHLGSGAGGMKFARGHGIVVRNSYVHDNLGNGVWCDVQCGDYTVVDNWISFNSRKGVHYEKSGESDEIVRYVGTAYIARNVVQNNGWGMREHGDAGIRGVSSKNMIIEHNILGGNVFNNGIKINEDGRLSGDRHGWPVSNIVIHRNTMNGDRIKGCELSGVTCS